ncbi:MAG: hypothetical protein IPM60_08655 [Rhodospirillales bacterium]|nr:hypothetical protein [Rhodospirillales bacterium]
MATGNWEAFPASRIPEVREAAEGWAAALRGIEKAWLCWCVSDRWCVLQQKLVQYVGWTPVVGHDTNVENPTVVPGSIYIDFNSQLKLPRLYPHFAMEWIHLFADRLAFWHSDFVVSKRDMEKAAKCFEDLKQGELAMPWGSTRLLMRLLAQARPVSNTNRLFEIIGCNTRQASLEQYQEGLGFWRHPEKHPNNTTLPDDYPHWEHSVGISLWARKHRDKHKLPSVDTRTGHAHSWGKGLRENTSKQELLDKHEDINAYAKKLGIEDLLR